MRQSSAADGALLVVFLCNAVITEGENMKKVPFVTKEQIDEIVKTYPTPFHIYDEKGIRENIRKVKKAFSWNKGYKEYFAVKATPNPYILQIMKEEGFGLDCATKVELMMAKACGFSGHDVMFSSNVTPADEYAYAKDMGVLINFDDITHLKFFEEKVGSFPETVCCRFNTGGDFKISKFIRDTPGESKYGFTREQLTEGFRYLMDHGVKHFGIHAFLASNTQTNDYYPTLAKILFQTAAELKAELGADIKFINLSGGVGVAYKPEDTPNDIEVIGEGVHKVFDEIMVPAGLGDAAIFTEMGRFMLAPYGHLVATAIHEKHIFKDYIGLDACAANLMRPMMYGAYHHITVAGKEDAPCDHMYDVTGGLCENSDKFAVNRMLPEIQVGDYIIIHDTGAHGFSMGYNYNGKLRSAELLLREDGSVQLIRRAETPADYFSTFDFTHIFDNIK